MLLLWMWMWLFLAAVDIVCVPCVTATTTTTAMTATATTGRSRSSSSNHHHHHHRPTIRSRAHPHQRQQQQQHQPQQEEEYLWMLSLWNNVVVGAATDVHVDVVDVDDDDVDNDDPTSIHHHGRFLQQQQQQPQQPATSTNTTTIPASATPAAGDFDQINSILAGTVIRINETSFNISDTGTGNETSCGPLSFFDWNLQLDVTDLVNEELANQGSIQVPADALGLRRERQRQLGQEHEQQEDTITATLEQQVAVQAPAPAPLPAVAVQAQQHQQQQLLPLLLDTTRHFHHHNRQLQECPAPGTGQQEEDILGSLLSNVNLDLQLQFGKEINELLDDTVIKIPKTTVKFDELVAGDGGDGILGGILRQRQRDLLFQENNVIPKRTTTNKNQNNNIKMHDSDQQLLLAAAAAAATTTNSATTTGTMGGLQDAILQDFTRRLRDLEATTATSDFVNVLQEFSGTPANAAEQLSIVWGEELSNFINQFKFTLDDFKQTETLEILGITFELDLIVQDVVCKNFEVEQVTVDIQNNSKDFSNIDVSIATSITKLKGDCTGSVSYGIGHFNAQADLDVTIGAKSLDLGVTFAGGALTVNSCSTEIRVLSLTVTNVRVLFKNVSDEIVSAVLARVEDLIFGFIENAANEAICPALESAFAANGATMVGALLDAMEETAAQDSLFIDGFAQFQGVCKDFYISGGVDVSISGPIDNLSVGVTVYKFTGTCYVDIKLSLDIGVSITMSASTVTAIATDKTSLKFNLADGFTATSCKTDFTVAHESITDVVINGLKIPQDLVDVTVSFLTESALKFINDLAPEVICGALDGSGTGALGNILRGRRRLEDVFENTEVKALQIQDIQPKMPINADVRHEVLERHLQDINADFKVKNVVVFDITVGSVIVTTEQKSNTAIGVNIAIDNVHLTITGDVQFKIAEIKGSASFYAELQAPVIDLDLLLISPDLCNELPSSGCLVGCSADLTVKKLVIKDVHVQDIPNSIVDTVVDALYDPIIEIVEDSGGEIICQQAESLVPDLIAGFLPDTGGGGNATQETTIRNLVCTNLSLQNLDLTSRKESDQLVVVDLGVDGLRVPCTGDIEFALGSITGTAQIQFEALVDLDLALGWTSPNFSTTPPNNVTIVSCAETLTPTSTSVSNLVVAGVPDAITPALEGLIDGLIGDFFASSASGLICGNADSFLPPLRDITNEISGNLEPFVEQRDPVDPLTAENAYTPPEGVRIVDFTTDEGTPGGWIIGLLKSPFISAEQINGILESEFLDEDGALVISGEQLGDEPLTFSNDIADIAITITEVRVYGLNTFTNIGERTFYGKYTFGAPFSLSDIQTSVDLDVVIELKGNEQIDFGNPAPIEESITIMYNATDVTGNFSVFTAFEYDVMEQLGLPVLLSEPECILAAADAINVTQLEFSKNVSDPIISGFSSPGTQRLMQAWLDALWLKYEPTLLLGMPNIAQDVIPPTVNDQLIAILANPTCEILGIVPTVQTNFGESDITEFNHDETDYGEAAGAALGFNPGETDYGKAAGTTLAFDPHGGAVDDSSNTAEESRAGFDDSTASTAVTGGPIKIAEDGILRWKPLAHLNLQADNTQRVFFRNGYPNH